MRKVSSSVLIVVCAAAIFSGLFPACGSGDDVDMGTDNTGPGGPGGNGVSGDGDSVSFAGNGPGGSGDPNGGGAPQWPQYDAQDQWQILHIDVETHAGPDPYRERYLFLQSVWGKPQPESAAE